MHRLTQHPQFSLVIVCFSELIAAELSSASESVEPGLINLGRFQLMCSQMAFANRALANKVYPFGQVFFTGHKSSHCCTDICITF